MSTIRIKKNGEVKYSWTKEYPEWTAENEGQEWLLKHVALGTFGNPGEYEIDTTDDPESYKQDRNNEFAKLQFEAVEAIVDKILGDETKWIQYLEKRDAIKDSNKPPVEKNK